MIFRPAYYQVKTPVIRKIVFTMSSAPSTFDITKATLRYDKDIAMSLRFDDGYVDAYRTAFPLFNGGDIIYRLGGSVNDYPGLFFTDGCGNNVKFKCEIAINSSSVETLAAPTNRMNWTMISEIYNAGWGIYNHGANEVVTDGGTFGGYNPASQITEINTLVASEIDEGNTDLRDNTGIKNLNFTAPSNDNLYDPVCISRANAGELKVVNNIRSPQKDAYLEPFEYWFTVGGGRIAGIGADYDFINLVESSSLQLDATDLDFMSTAISGLSAGEHIWFANGLHRCDYADSETPASVDIKFTEMRDVFERIENTYGKDGNDSIWFAPQNEIYEYVFTSELSVLSTVIDGTTVTVTCDFSNVPADYREHALSLVVDADQNISSIAFENFDVSSSDIGYSGDNSTALVNCSYNPAYESAILQRGRAEVLVSNLEQTQQQSDLDAAQSFIDTLPNGSYKTALQVRIDNVTVIPDSVVVQVDIGSNLGGRESASPWNNLTDTQGFTTLSTGLTNMIDTTSSATTWDLSVTKNFAGVETNTSALNTHVNNPFTYEALRDSWETETNDYSEITISGLDNSKVYDFLFCSSRGSVHLDTLYTVAGTNSGQDYHLTKNNGSGDVYDTALIEGISPSSGSITVRVEGSVGLTPNSSNRGYLGAMQITERNP